MSHAVGCKADCPVTWRTTRIRVSSVVVVGTVLAILALLCVPASCAQKQAWGELFLDVRLPRAAHGQIAYLVFMSAAGFPSNRDYAIRRGFAALSVDGAGVQRIDTGELPPGRYAVSVYLDENSNRKLDKNWMGIPTEPVGASNNPKVRLRAPRFDECSFNHGAAAEIVPITLVQ